MACTSQTNSHTQTATLKDWSIEYSWAIVQTNTYSNKRVILSQFRVCFVKKVYKIDQNERAEVE